MKAQKFTFNTKKVMRCITHALTSREWCMWNNNATAEKNRPLTDPSLLVIRDAMGVYITSAGFPRDRLRNKKFYCVYSEEQNINNLVEKYTSACADWPGTPARSRIACLLTIPLSVGENGHCYEEYLAEGFERLIVTLPTESTVEFGPKRKTAHTYFKTFDENDDKNPVDETMFNGKRRIQKDTENVEKT